MKLSAILFAITTGLLVSTIMVGGLTERRISEPLAVPLDQIPAEINGWTKVKDSQLDAGTVKQLKPSSYLTRTYRKGAVPLDLFIAFYEQQRAGESMHSPKHCLPGAGWEIWRHGTAMIPDGDRQVAVNKYSIQNNGTRMIMYYWYQSKGRIVADEYTGKIMLAKDTLISGQTAGSIVRIMLPDTPAADAEAVAFASKMIPEMRRCITGDRNPRAN